MFLLLFFLVFILSITILFFVRMSWRKIAQNVLIIIFGVIFSAQISQDFEFPVYLDILLGVIFIVISFIIVAYFDSYSNRNKSK